MRAAEGSAAGFYLAQTRHDPWRGIAAPRSLARQTLPRQRSAFLVAATSALCLATMHSAAQAFGRARKIDTAKSVSLKKIGDVKFKISFQKILKLKKEFKKSILISSESLLCPLHARNFHHNHVTIIPERSLSEILSTHLIRVLHPIHLSYFFSHETMFFSHNISA